MVSKAGRGGTERLAVSLLDPTETLAGGATIRLPSDFLQLAEEVRQIAAVLHRSVN